MSTLLTLFYTDYAGIPAATVGFGNADFPYIRRRIRCYYGICCITYEVKNGDNPDLGFCGHPFHFVYLLFCCSPVPQTTATLQFIYLFVTYNFCTTICYTALNLPYGSLSAMLTRDSKERDMVSVFSYGNVSVWKNSCRRIHDADGKDVRRRPEGICSYSCNMVRNGANSLIYCL